MLEIYRHAVRCTECCKRTKCTEQAVHHYHWCREPMQDTEMLQQLLVKISKSISKRKATMLQREHAAAQERLQALQQIYTVDATNKLVRVKGSAGLYITRRESCTCPGYKAHKHCKHYTDAVAAYREMQALQQTVAVLASQASEHGVSL